MLQVFNGIAFGVGQSVEHPLRWFPANRSVGSQVPHRVSSLLEFVQDFRDESMLAFGGRARFPLLARDIDPEFQLFGHPQFHFLQPVRRSYAFEISVCLSVASGMRQTLLKLGAREVALSNISQRTPRRPRFSRVFCFRRAPPHESAQLCREDALGYSVAVTPMDHSALNRYSFRQSRELRTSHPRARSRVADHAK
jgi:hypothetical protein